MPKQPDSESQRDGLYGEAAATYGAALERLARAYESDAERRLDLLQEIHVALWRSLAAFDGHCSLRTWVYRVAHNVAISQVIRRRRSAPTLVGLDELDSMADPVDPGQLLDDRFFAVTRSRVPVQPAPQYHCVQHRHTSLSIGRITFSAEVPRAF